MRAPQYQQTETTQPTAPVSHGQVSNSFDSLGAGIQRLGGAVQQYMDETAMADGANNSNEFETETRGITTNYKNQLGTNAVEQREKARQEIQAAYDKRAAKLSGKALETFKRNADPILGGSFINVDDHAFEQDRGVKVSAFETASKNSAKQSIEFWGNKPAQDASFKLMSENMQEAAKLTGEAKSVTDSRIAGAISATHANVVEMLIDTKKIGDAQAYFKTHGDTIQPVERGQLAKRLNGVVVSDEGLARADKIDAELRADQKIAEQTKNGDFSGYNEAVAKYALTIPDAATRKEFLYWVRDKSSTQQYIFNEREAGVAQTMEKEIQSSPQGLTKAIADKYVGLLSPQRYQATVDRADKFVVRVDDNDFIKDIMTRVSKSTSVAEVTQLEREFQSQPKRWKETTLPTVDNIIRYQYSKLDPNHPKAVDRGLMESMKVLSELMDGNNIKPTDPLRGQASLMIRDQWAIANESQKKDPRDFVYQLVQKSQLQVSSEALPEEDLVAQTGYLQREPVVKATRPDLVKWSRNWRDAPIDIGFTELRGITSDQVSRIKAQAVKDAQGSTGTGQPARALAYLQGMIPRANILQYENQFMQQNNGIRPTFPQLVDYSMNQEVTKRRAREQQTALGADTQFQINQSGYGFSLKNANVNPEMNRSGYGNAR